MPSPPEPKGSELESTCLQAHPCFPRSPISDFPLTRFEPSLGTSQVNLSKEVKVEKTPLRGDYFGSFILSVREISLGRGWINFRCLPSTLFQAPPPSGAYAQAPTNQRRARALIGQSGARGGKIEGGCGIRLTLTACEEDKRATGRRRRRRRFPLAIDDQAGDSRKSRLVC